LENDSVLPNSQSIKGKIEDINKSLNYPYCPMPSFMLRTHPAFPNTNAAIVYIVQKTGKTGRGKQDGHQPFDSTCPLNSRHGIQS
ncbi:unnamed protein product, partial [Nesidiocoris tenuis]